MGDDQEAAVSNKARRSHPGNPPIAFDMGDDQEAAVSNKSRRSHQEILLLLLTLVMIKKQL